MGKRRVRGGEEGRNWAGKRYRRVSLISKPVGVAYSDCVLPCTCFYLLNFVHPHLPVIREWHLGWRHKLSCESESCAVLEMC